MGACARVRAPQQGPGLTIRTIATCPSHTGNIITLAIINEATHHLRTCMRPSSLVRLQAQKHPRCRLLGCTQHNQVHQRYRTRVHTSDGCTAPDVAVSTTSVFGAGTTTGTTSASLSASDSSLICGRSAGQRQAGHGQQEQPLGNNITYSLDVALTAQGPQAWTHRHDHAPSIHRLGSTKRRSVSA